VARRQHGSKRRKQAVHLLAKAQQPVARQRADFPHQTALALLREHDTISLDDWRVANLVRSHALAKRISDAGWAAFRTILDAKAACGLGVGGSRCTLPPPRRNAAGVGSACPRV
jgi:putative transposase